MLRGINVGGHAKCPWPTCAPRSSTWATTTLRPTSRAATCSSAPSASAAALVLGHRTRPRGALRPRDQGRAAHPGAAGRSRRANPLATRRPGPGQAPRDVPGSKPPASRRVGSRRRTRSCPDEFRVAGREVYLHCPEGYGRTKLTNAFFERALGGGGHDPHLEDRDDPGATGGLRPAARRPHPGRPSVRRDCQETHRWR